MAVPKVNGHKTKGSRPLASRRWYWRFAISIPTLIIVIDFVPKTKYLAHKLYRQWSVVSFVQSCESQVSVTSLQSNADWLQLVDRLRAQLVLTGEAPAFLLLNEFAIEMTLNWLCNTKHMKRVHERTIIVTLTEQANKLVKQIPWPQNRTLHWPVDCLKVTTQH
jgi:hypothetical protein